MTRAILQGLSVCLGSWVVAGCTLGMPVPAVDARAADQSAQIARLEARLAQLESQQANRQRAERSSADRRMMDKLDQLIALDQELLDRNAAQAAPAATSSTQSTQVAPSGYFDPSGTPAPSQSTLSFRERLQALVAEYGEGRVPGHGGLSLEQDRALRVLLRPERLLDARNPWTDRVYIDR